MWRREVKWSMLLIMLISLWLGRVAIVQAAPLQSQTVRLYGSTRIETAIKVSQRGWSRADTVLLARADDFPDSLVAVPLSHRLNAPILMTYSVALDSNVLNEIKRLGAKKVILLGGQGVLGNKITGPLEKAGLKWERIGGADRYETAALIAKRLGSNGSVILASGENFPDALAIAPYAGITETPILLTTAKALPASTQASLKELMNTGAANGGEAEGKIYVIGGEGVIPSKTLRGLPGIERIAGQDRYETAAKAYWFASDALIGSPDNRADAVYLVTGEDFPDALVVGALAARENTFLFMAGRSQLPAVTYSALGNATEGGIKVIIIGGSGVLSTTVEQTVQGILQPPYLLGGSTIVVDPGHGSPDTGAIGPSGTREKDNNLAVALDLAELLRAAGAKVILTRSTDKAPVNNYTEAADLQARTQIANNAKADLFVSIHNDSFTNPQAGGTTTYFSSDNPKADASAQLAKTVQAAVVKQLGLYDRGTKNAGFYVLKHTNMPAVLVELGFISNPEEEKLLADESFQKKAALGIYRGILTYKGY